MSETTTFVLKLTLVLLFLIQPIYLIQSGRRKIHKILEKKHAKNVVVDFLPFGLPFGLDRNAFFYDVKYEDETGRVYITKCKKYWWDSTIYWLDEDFQYK